MRLMYILLFSFLLCAHITYPQDTFSIITCKLDLPKDPTDYNHIYENRTKHVLQELNEHCQDDIICLQGLALTYQKLASCMSSYMIASYANGCAILLKKYTKSFMPNIQIPFLHGTYVALRLQAHPEKIIYICSADCYNNHPHKGCIHIEDNAPILYFGPNIAHQTHVHYSQLYKLAHQKDEDACIAAKFFKEQKKQFHISVDEFTIPEPDTKNKSSQNKKLTTSPIYKVTVQWKEFIKVLPTSAQHTALISNIKVPIKHDHSEYIVTEPKKVYLPFGLPVKPATQNLSCLKEQEVIGKPLPIKTVDHIRRLEGCEFSVLSWHFTPQDSLKNKQAALEELASSGVDIVCLQGIQDIYLDVLYPYYNLIKRSDCCALLTNKRSSLIGKEALDHIEINGISCKICDINDPAQYIRIWNIMLDPGTLYNSKNIFTEENAIITGCYLHNIKNMITNLKTVHPYFALGCNHDQICVLSKTSSVILLTGSTFWEEQHQNVYSAIGITTKYGRLVEHAVQHNPLYATFDWKEIRRYKNEIPDLRGLIEKTRIETGAYH